MENQNKESLKEFLASKPPSPAQLEWDAIKRKVNGTHITLAIDERLVILQSKRDGVTSLLASGDCDHESVKTWCEVLKDLDIQIAEITNHPPSNEKA